MSKSKVSASTASVNGEPVPPAPPSDGPMSPAAPDPFDPTSLRLSQDFAAGLGVKKALLAVPVRKPGKTAFLRVHPSADYTLATMLLVDDGDRNSTYLIAPALRSALAAEPACAPWQLYTAIDRQSSLFLWNVRLPGIDGKGNLWWDTAHEAAARARTNWVRIAAPSGGSAYDVWEATGDLPAPAWPDVAFGELLRIAFRDRMIDNMDHPILRRLRGDM